MRDPVKDMHELRLVEDFQFAEASHVEQEARRGDDPKRRSRGAISACSGARATDVRDGSPGDASAPSRVVRLAGGFAPVAQQEEHPPCKREDAGSDPAVGCTRKQIGQKGAPAALAVSAHRDTTGTGYRASYPAGPREPAQPSETGLLGFRIAAGAVGAGIVYVLAMLLWAAMGDGRQVLECGQVYETRDGAVIVVECSEPDDAPRSREVWR